MIMKKFDYQSMKRAKDEKVEKAKVDKAQAT